jgi:hypothetical protein
MGFCMKDFVTWVMLNRMNEDFQPFSNSASGLKTRSPSGQEKVGIDLKPSLFIY